MRMVVFSLILMLVIIFARKGIMGRKEFGWTCSRAACSGAGRDVSP